MKKLILPLTAMLLGALPAAADEVVRTMNQAFQAQAADEINLDFPVGELVVQAWDEPQVKIEAKIECDSNRGRCAEAAKALRLVANTRGQRLHIELQGWPKNSTGGLEANLEVKVPRNLPLIAELGVGKMDISGIENDLKADVGVGEVRIAMPQSAVGSVHLDSGVGDASLSAGGKHYDSSGFIGKELKWTRGTGDAKIDVDCGVGEINVELR
ncbi:MAG TPA: hypothetical protein VMW27_07525 [Thermoanaerobaculia bacterium]|nr:hypothetical protein [Thermoanaerobaculia bacterium]